MMTSISVGLTIFAGLLSIPIVVLFVEVVAAFRVTKSKPVWVVNPAANKSVAVIVPAHNESIGIVPTIEDIKPQLNAGDRLIVIADNCTDDTAKIAGSAGAHVISRNDAEKIGKGYALGHGINYVSNDPPDFVVFVDADCRLPPSAIEELKAFCDATRRPIQACYLMKSPGGSPINHSFAEFTFLLRNLVRPLGLSNLDCPVQLMGTGMAFPWDVIRGAPLASGHLVEDLKLGLDLAASGSAPLFLPFVTVTSDFPVTAKGTETQRQRWVQGHLGMIWKRVPSLLVEAIRHRNWDLLALTLDLLVPPLSLLGILIAGVFGLTAGVTLLGGSPVSLLIALANLALFALALVVAWHGFGREILPARGFLSIGPLIVKRFALYGRMLIGRTVDHWVRTDRGGGKPVIPRSVGVVPSSVHVDER
jgi:cellulose synthase/poly-beta-1,6-N-acetylglucosamine synthase-like glycosyltransferase